MLIGQNDINLIRTTQDKQPLDLLSVCYTLLRYMLTTKHSQRTSRGTIHSLVKVKFVNVKDNQVKLLKYSPRYLVRY